MGGFGALKYAAKHYGHFASVSAHFGPDGLRRDFGLAAHWANASSTALDLGGGIARLQNPIVSRSSRSLPPQQPHM